jgi:folate-binding Fe-S cluster repair protein YgfZ
MKAYFNRFTVIMTKDQALSCSHQGECYDDCKELAKNKVVIRQFKKIAKEDIAQELKEYGAWDKEELENNEENIIRILWLAANNIKEESLKCYI